ncbi:MAG: tRNA lysidine(34) synthetase TilS [Jiangellaceae bacterium]|nr:tRNA lysidine(34) synthetase TilS [Jiangellaceae bacterium]
MAAPHLAVRRAVRESLRDVPNDALVLVACSGGADSLALAGALAHLAARKGRSAGGITVDHGLQPGSADRGRGVAAALVRLRLDPVEVIHVCVPDAVHGPEGNARTARYRALGAAAARLEAAAVLLGHTRDDQAESVLLGLARGSGARSLSGMAPVSGRYRRPLLNLPRETVRAAVPGGLTAWHDPHNVDPAFARARVRHRVLPVLEQELGPGIASALARSATLLRADADALDVWAERALAESHLGEPGTVDQRLDPGLLATYPVAVRRRVLRRAAIAAGCPVSDLTAAHVEAIDALVSRWKGQRGVDLPGKLRASRFGGELRIGPVD